MNPHLQAPVSPVSLLASAWQNRLLVLQLARREVLTRYQGSALGLVWSFVVPLVMLAIYTFFFSVIFRARWGMGTDETKASFAIILFVGLIMHGLLAECLNRAPGLIVNNPSYVKKVVFPLDVLPWSLILSAVFHALVSVVVLLVVQLLINHNLPWTVVLLPVVMFPLVLTGMGISWFLASIGVFVRDVTQITGVLTTVLLFLAPVFYPLTLIPEQYRPFLFLNPLTVIIEQARKILILGELPDLLHIVVATIVSAIIAWAGYWWFQRTRKGFADVL